MLDDIIEAVIDIAGDILEAVIRFRRKKSSTSGKNKPSQQAEPWLKDDQPAPWEK